MPFKKGHKIWKGKHLSDEHKEKIRVSKKGQIISPEQRKKISDTLKKNPVRYWLGRKRIDVTGPKCHLWRGGVTSVNNAIRASLEYKIWRRAVFERDKYTCVWGGREHGNRLEADHIKPFSLYPALRFAIDNGRTLCKNCHKKTDTYGRKNKKHAK